jgi:hypothetical protein
MIPTEPIGSIPRPSGPAAAICGGAGPGALALVQGGA